MYVYEYLFWLMHPTTQQFGALFKRDTLFSFDIYLYKSSFTLVKKAWWIQAASGRILSITVRVVTLRVHKITFIIVGNKCFPKIDISSQNTNFVFFFLKSEKIQMLQNSLLFNVLRFETDWGISDNWSNGRIFRTFENYLWYLISYELH